MISVPVRVMRIGYMRVRVARGFVSMGMAVRPHGHGIMRMRVMPVIMNMSMLVGQFLMNVLVSVRLDEVQHHAQ